MIKRNSIIESRLNIFLKHLDSSFFVKIFLMVLVIACNQVKVQNNEQPNILFIAIDDLNDWTGFLKGHPQAITPNMDQLASAGLNFTNAHCSAPGCSPSRNAILFGKEPFNSGLYAFYDKEIHTQLTEKYTSLPRLLKENGYETFGAGKIHHSSVVNENAWTDYLRGIEEKKVFAPNEGYVMEENSSKMSFRPTINPYEEHVDYQIASYGLDILQKKHEKPFFLAVGLIKPHLPFDAPKAFFDALPEQILPPLLFDQDLSDIPKEGQGDGFRRVANVARIEKDDAWNEVRRAYLASISWTDFNVGRVLDALENSPYAKNTVIVLWSDHGFHLGEKMTFKKFTLWEEATKVPFIIRDLRQSNTKGREISDPVSLINIYRTIADLAGIEAPEYVDGFSLLPLIKDPEVILETPALTTWGRGNYAVRSKDWRYIRYFDGTEELYNHKDDANEWYNVSDKASSVSKKKEMMSFIPENEEPLIKEYTLEWSVQGADRKRVKE